MTDQSDGRKLHDDDPEARKAAAALMGSARTDRKVSASRQNAAKATDARRGQSPSEETREKLRAAQAARRAREAAALETGKEGA